MGRHYSQPALDRGHHRYVQAPRTRKVNRDTDGVNTTRAATLLLLCQAFLSVEAVAWSDSLCHSYQALVPCLACWGSGLVWQSMPRKRKEKLRRQWKPLPTLIKEKKATLVPSTGLTVYATATKHSCLVPLLPASKFTGPPWSQLQIRATDSTPSKKTFYTKREKLRRQQKTTPHII